MVCVFARQTSEPLTSLVKQIDEQIGENNQLKSFVVLLTQEGDEAAQDLRKMATSANIKHVPLTIHGDPAEVPDYELSKEADVTVLMWRDHTVKVNHAFKGVAIPAAGRHEVTFAYWPRHFTTALWLGAAGLGALLAGFAWLWRAPRAGGAA